MFNSKKLVLSGLCLASVMTAGSVVAATATVLWTGDVPSSVTDGSIIITGAGQSNDLTGAIAPAIDGTFRSPAIRLESWEYKEGAIGENMKAASWKVVSAKVNYDYSAPTSPLDIDVYIDGAVVAEGATVYETDGAKYIDVSIHQKTALDDVEGTAAQASVNLEAKAI